MTVSIEGLEPVYDRWGVRVFHADCLIVLRAIPDASVHAILTDPPYGLSELSTAKVTAALSAWLGGDREHVPDGAGFMSMVWDSFVPPPVVWDECLRVLKPGGHMLVFAGSRTVDLMGLSIRLAGFQIRDSIIWHHAEGFAKSLDVGKAIDRARDDRDDINRVTGWLAEQRDRAGVTNRQIDEAFGFNGMAGHWTAAAHLKIAQVPNWEQWERLRELIGFGDEMDVEVWRLNGRKGTPGEVWGRREVVDHRADRAGNGSVVGLGSSRSMSTEFNVTAPATDAARQWSGWGTATKPSQEPVIMARKPLSGTIASTVLAHATGALHIDACRVEGALGGDPSRFAKTDGGAFASFTRAPVVRAEGRWPPNVVFSHVPLLDSVSGEVVGDACVDECVDGCPVRELDQQSGVRTSKPGVVSGSGTRFTGDVYATDDYTVNMTRTPFVRYADTGGASKFFPCFRFEAKATASERPRVNGVSHPTVKPRALCQWLVRLVTPPGGTVLDVFAGSGTVGLAARAEGFGAVLVENDPLSIPLIVARLDAHPRTEAPDPATAAPPPMRQGDLFDLLDDAP